MKRESRLYRQLVKLAKEKPQVRSHLVPLIKESGKKFRIGPGGLEDLSSGITLQENTEYFLGASSSPKHIVITKLSPTMITYRTYPYKKDIRIERDIGEDLIMQGVSTWLKSGYPRYQPELAKSLKSMMSGGRGKKVDIRDFQLVKVLVEPRNPDPENPGWDIDKGDLWRHVEQYGNVGMMGDVYEVDTDMARAKEIVADPLLVTNRVTFR